MATDAADDEVIDSAEEPTVSHEVGGIALFEDEEVLHDFHPSWVAWWKSITVIVLLSLFLFPVAFGLTLVLLYFPWRARKRTRYVVTSDRIIVREASLMSSSTHEFTFDRIRQISTGRSAIEKLLGHGNIHVVFHGGTDFRFSGTPNYDKVANTIRHAQHRE